MNCKPGDLAIVVRTGPKSVGCLGAVIRVTKLGTNPTGRGPAWEYKPTLRNADGEPILWANDSCLRPIRDPGDDAQDESFRWAPAPEKVTA